MRMERDRHRVVTIDPRSALTRRRLLGGAAGIAAAASLPRIAAGDDVSPVMARLSTYMSEAAARALPQAVVQETKHHILDTLAAMISGSELPPGQRALRFARRFGGEKIATIVASDL